MNVNTTNMQALYIKCNPTNAFTSFRVFKEDNFKFYIMVVNLISFILCPMYWVANSYYNIYLYL